MNKRGSLSICGSYDVGSFSVVVNQPEANVLMKGQFPGTFCNDGGTMVYTLQDRSWAAPVCVWGPRLVATSASTMWECVRSPTVEPEETLTAAAITKGMEFPVPVRIGTQSELRRADGPGIHDRCARFESLSHGSAIEGSSYRVAFMNRTERPAPC